MRRQQSAKSDPDRLRMVWSSLVMMQSAMPTLSASLMAKRLSQRLSLCIGMIVTR
jgi:hypothetical protein